MISNEEKEQFLESLEQDNAKVLKSQSSQKTEIPSPTPPKKTSPTAIFATVFVFFIFIILLLIFILSLSGSGNPIFQSFGIEPYEIKNFLISLVNKIFMVISILLLLLVTIGLFRGYTLQEDSQKKGSFFFAGVAGGLVFVSILVWGGAIAFVNNFTTEAIGKQNIEILGFSGNDQIIAPVDISFSASNIIMQYKRQGETVIGIRWSKDDGKTFSPSSLNERYTFQFFQKGIQKITMEASLLSGKVDTYTRGFTIDGATFLLSPSAPIQGKIVTFDASSLHEGSGTYRWDFNNDGVYDMSSRLSKATYTFDMKGEQTVHLRIEGDNDSVETYSKTFVVLSDGDKALDAVIALSSEPQGKTPFEVTFDGSASSSQLGSITEYSWKIPGERLPKKGMNITYVFTKSGTYSVELTVKTETGKTDTEKVDISVTQGNSAPVAILTSKPAYNDSKKALEGFTPLETTLYAKDSRDAENNITDYAWSIMSPSGVEEKKYGDTLQYAFREIGTYSLTLSVTDKEGASDAKTIQVLVKEPPVVPSVKAFPQSGIAPLITEFNASESFCRQTDCKILSYEWDFGDGSPVLPSGAIVTHQFSKEGTFITSMTAITNTGEKATAQVTVTVTKQPLVSCFTSSRSEGKAPIKISFDPSCSQGNIAQYKWDFGDGYVSALQKPTHSFTDPGTYTVRLQAISKDGNVAEMKTVVTIH